MLSLEYEKIFSRVRGNIDDPKEMSLNENDLVEIYTERLHSVVGNPRVRRKFLTLKLDDEIQQLDFELNYPVDDDSDIDFVIELFALGMTIKWLQPQVDSVTNTAKMIGGKEEKLILNNYKPNMDRLNRLETKLDKLIRDYGYIHNSYIEGT